MDFKIYKSRLSYHRCRLNSCGMYLRVMRRHTVEVRQFTHLHANRLTGIRHTTGYGTTSIPESRNAASTRPRAETSLRHSCNKWCHPARHLHLSLNHLTSECRMYHRAMLPMMPSASLMESQYPVTSSNSLKTIPTWTSTMPNASSRKNKRPSRKSVKALSSALHNLKNIILQKRPAITVGRFHSCMNYICFQNLSFSALAAPQPL